MNFKWFKKILDFYNNIDKIESVNPSLNYKTNQTKEEVFFKDQFNQFLKIEDALFCYKMIEDGFIATETQKSKLNRIILEKIENNEYDYREIINIQEISIKNKINATVKHLSKNHYVNYEEVNITPDAIKYRSVIIEFFKNRNNKVEFITYVLNHINDYKKFYVDGLDIIDIFSKQSDGQVQKEKTKILSIMYLTALLIKTEVITQDEALTIKEEFRKCSQVMYEKTSKKFLEDSLRKVAYGSLQKFIQTIGQIQAELVSDKRQEILDKYKSYATKQKTLTEEIEHIVIKNEYSIDNLPKEAKEKVNHITKILKDLESEEVNQFAQERIPMILKKYFSIDEEYRTTLKNVEGFNAQELMIQSLENIERIIVAKKEDNNYDLLSELSVENRKLKMRKA